jgi:hypothetical protein
MGKRPTPKTSPAPDPVPPAPAGESDDRIARARQLRVVWDDLEHCRVWHQWGDPFLGAWRAYEVARGNGVDPPEWVERYLRRVAMLIGEISYWTQEEMRRSGKEPSGKALGAKILRALGITRPGPSIFRRRLIGWRDRALADRVLDLVASGEQVKAAVRKVARSHMPPVDKSVVVSAWRRFHGRRIGRRRKA